jgi:two-component system, cell cycle sensor histidine kinase and response regulator CckA
VNGIDSPEADFAAIFRALPGQYLVVTPELEIVAVSDAYLAATRTTRGDILGHGLFDVFPNKPASGRGEGVANLRASLERVIESKRPDALGVQRYELRLHGSADASCETRYFSVVNAPVLNESGRLRYIVHRVEDVTEFVEQRGIDRKPSISNREPVSQRTLAVEAEIFERARQLQESNRELVALKSSLEARVQARTAELLRANHELEREVARHRNTAEALKHSETQLRQAQKMEAIGRLAGSVAHDFNNMLSVIVGATDLLLEELKPLDPIRSDVDAIRKASQRASALTRQLLAFSRQQVLAPRILDLNELIQELQKMLARLLGADIELVLRCERGLPPVRVDPSQIDQVIMNLAINARDAMPNGGKLTIETQSLVLDGSYASQHFGTAAGPHVMLAVSDTGTGMDKETQARIFEPFFTTKDVGKGTGLGLSTVFGIVKQSGGNVWVYSELGVGTTFRIYLPSAVGVVPFEASELTQPTRLRGSETVLLVEDQEDVLHVTRQILRRYGYHVLPARNAGEALLICEQHPRTIHLLLTDLVMPQMGGRQLAQRLLKLRPEVRVLFMSGYAEAACTEDAADAFSSLVYMQKPIVPEELARRVRSLLDAPKRRSSGPPSG